MRGKLFLTDADYKHTLGAIRSLGRKGLEVDAGSSLSPSLGFFSKYINQCFVYPDPKKCPKEFIDFILKIIRTGEYNVIMPIGYAATVTISKFKKRIEHLVEVPVTDFERLRVASRKDETIVLAKELGIPVPDSIILRNGDLERAKDLDFPLVLKGTTESGRVYYASNFKDFVKKFYLLRQLTSQPLIAQKYIRGDGYGFFALFSHGEPRATFMHKRIREYPITGGPSTVAESVYEPRLKDYGLRILNALSWHGVAMVEFRHDVESNNFKLMEINPKFWGSLDLAIASGVDFPYLLYKMAVNGDVKPSFNYTVGVKFMWPFPDDFKHILANPYAFTDFITDLTDVSVRKNFVLRDLKPNIVQLLGIVSLLKHMHREYEEFRYPHIMPRTNVA